jgi:DNA-binding NtrC family response regulator
VGGIQPIVVDIRMIAATHRDLEEMVQKGTFRDDLWFRLNVFPIVIPALRERLEDIPALAHHFLEVKSRELKLGAFPTLGRGAMDRLMGYHWPGNVRELENVIERELILSRGEPLRFDQLALPPRNPRPPASPAPLGEVLRLDDAVSRHIRHALRMTQGKVHGEGGAAELLGVNPSTLRNRMNKLGIPYGRRAKQG